AGGPHHRAGCGRDRRERYARGAPGPRRPVRPAPPPAVLRVSGRQPIEPRLTGLWYRERAGSSLLAPLAWSYGALMRARHRAYASGWVRTERAGRPVGVGGNLTVGGAGQPRLTIRPARPTAA